MSTTHQDFADILAALNDAHAEFVIVGAYAMAAHGVPRATGDLDLLVRPSPENAVKVYQALLAFGAPVQAHQLTAQDFERPDLVYQLGLPPRRIDILTSISGVSFDEAMRENVVGTLGMQRVHFIGRSPLVRNKRATGRPKDRIDADLLEGK